MSQKRNVWKSGFICGLGLFLLNGSYSQASPASLSPDQRAFEQFEMSGGSFSLSWSFPYGGGALMPHTHFIDAYASGGLTVSPSQGPQTEIMALKALDADLPQEPLQPTYVFANGKIQNYPALPQKRVSYTDDGRIKIDSFADDNQTVVASSILSNFQNIPLNGLTLNSPDEVLQDIPLDVWMGGNNFSTNARWLQGSAYTKYTVYSSGDQLQVSNCTLLSQKNAGLKPASGPLPCAAGVKLEKAFPVQIGGDPEHPEEVNFIEKGKITQIQGLRAWVSNDPIEYKLGYRVFFEYNQNVYMGFLKKDGTKQLLSQLGSGAIVDYNLKLNSQALTTIQQNIISGANTGSKAGKGSPVVSDDLFGIGGHGVNGALSAADLRAHYHIPPELTGEGQTIVIVDGPTNDDTEADLNAYSDYNQIPRCTKASNCLQLIDMGTGAPADDNWGVEVDLDVQMVHAIAPKAKIVLITAADASSDSLAAAVSLAISIPNATAISMSFGGPSRFTNENQLFGDGVKKGLIFFASTGDSGYQGMAQFPAGNPFVTAVGGTAIHSVVRTADLNTETAWEFTGGGLNLYEQMPDYQKALLGNSSTFKMRGIPMRAIPDVSAVADPKASAVATYNEQMWGMSGGTSVSSPIWAGISAIIGESVAKHGKSLRDFVIQKQGFNPALYSIQALQSEKDRAILDVISGSNALTAKAGPLCKATPGYDTVTGLGVPDVAQLLTYFP